MGELGRQREIDSLRLVTSVAGVALIVTPLLVLAALSVAGSDDRLRCFPAASGATVVGLVALVFPWQRFSPKLFHVLLVTACVHAAWAVSLAGSDADIVVWTFLLIGPMAAFALADWREIAVHLCFLTVCLVGGVVLAESTEATTGMAVIAVPSMWLITAAVAIVRRREIEQSILLASEVRMDALTGVGNRRLRDERLAYEVVRHQRSGKTMALITLDLDRFKMVNDAFGHPAGDQVLCNAAAALVAAVRDSDTVVRHGGDEFAVIAPEIETHAVDAMVQSLRRALATVDAAGAPLTAAIGWAVYPVDATSLSEIVDVADGNQLRDKRGVTASAWAAEPTRP